MNAFIPAFDVHEHLLWPWAEGLPVFGWVFLMGFLVCVACGLVGQYLALRRLALVGDAISHSVLPGLVVAFLIAGSRSSLAMLLGALAAGFLTTVLIEWIHKNSRVKSDAAIGIVFSSLFALGVILITLFAGQVDLDADCVLYGEIGFVFTEEPVALFGLVLGPLSVVRMAAVALLVAVLIAVFYKELLVTSFDAGLARSLGISPALFHYGLMAVLSLTVVSAFRAVGAILVIAMLILPAATATLLTDRMGRAFAWIVTLAALYSIGGVHLALWLNASTAASMTVVALGLFFLAWVLAPQKGLLAKAFHRRRREHGEPAAGSSAPETF